MPQRLRPLALWGLAAGLLLGVALSIALPTWASRNSAGTYSLPPGNPVIPGTPISSTWANSTLADIANELTSSLDRQGRGAMAAPLQLSTGTALAPSLTFSGDTNTGFYRPAADSVSLTLNGSPMQTWAAAASTLNSSLMVGHAGIADANLPLQINTTATNSTWLGVNKAGTYGALYGYSNASALFGTGAVIRTVNDEPIKFVVNSTVQMGQFASTGLTIGTTGTPISASYGATFNINHGNIGAGACVNSSPLTLNGVSVGGVCSVSVNTPHPSVLQVCNVTAANTVNVSACNVAAVTALLGAVDFHVRVFQP